jgi:hypothetical protein
MAPGKFLNIYNEKIWEKCGKVLPHFRLLKNRITGKAY